MSKKSKALAGATAVAAGPSGMRRVAAGCLLVVLLGGLALGALLGFAAWTATHSGDESAALPCPPQPVAVVWSTKAAPTAAREAVTEAVREAGREPATGGWGAEEKRDLVVVWSAGTSMTASTTSDPVKLTLGAVPTAAQVRAALGARLAACAAPAKTKTAPTPAAPSRGGHERPGGFSWPWERGLGTTGALGLALGAWWLVGPSLVRGVGRGFAALLWPLRLSWRKAQRAAYRRHLAQGLDGAAWPLRVSPGQRWHENDQAMHDRRPFRQQIAEGEPERRAALRKSIREERLAGTGFGPAPLWRHIYRTPAPERAGAPKKEEVLP